MQIGLFGMILMSWCLILAIITKDSLDYWKVAYVTYPTAIYMLPGFYRIYTSTDTTFYVRPNNEKVPVDLCVVLIAIAHLVIAGCIFMSQVYWLDCLIILFASFFFSIDLYWISTMNSYTLRRHYHYKWQFEPKGDIYSNVIITSKHFWEEDEIIQWTFV
ncbi:hypothetical protein GCK72_004913 [Caenorhabditis remanei]|uniref:Uncharacterized protein n=1 Tax=Caenorhabditis remanei TaxID=31234 RepID=A0A6A5HFL5_CAERE|nr:hypothetical protein GCK72_004913 [Caenorhabditis remanei]KAF1764962.1 hypothetical protein GCK72_004913 [Caenorhabditis remanei]